MFPSPTNPNMKCSYEELFLMLFLLSSTLADSWDWEFLISLRRHQKKHAILNIPHHTFTESREVFVWIQVKKPPDSDNDCLPTTIAQETEKIGSVNFKASHPNLPNPTQTFAVGTNETLKVKRVLCLSHFTQDSEKAISFEATVNKPVCRDVKVMLEMGGDDCHKTLEYDSAQIQTNHSEDRDEIKGDECDNTSEYDSANIQSNESKASHENEAGYTKINTLYSVIAILAVMLALFSAILFGCGWKSNSAMELPRHVGDVEPEESESLRTADRKTIDDNVTKSMGTQRGGSRNKNKIESEESDSLTTLDDNVPKSMDAKKRGKSRNKNKTE